MTTDVSEIRLLNDDVLLSHRPENKDRLIQLDDDEHESTAFRYDVIRVSPTVTHIKEGEIVVVPWRFCTPPFEIQRGEEKMNVVLTDQKEVLGVIDQ